MITQNTWSGLTRYHCEPRLASLCWSPASETALAIRGVSENETYLPILIGKMMANDGKWWEPSPIWSNGLPWYMIFSHNHISSLTLAPALKTARASSKAPRRENAWPRVFPKPLHQKVYPLFFILRIQHPSSERFCDFHVRVKKECPFSHKSTHKKPLCCLLNVVGQIR